MLIRTKNKIYKFIVLFIAFWLMLLGFRLNVGYFLLHPCRLLFSFICFVCSYALVYFYYDNLILGRKDCKNEE